MKPQERIDITVEPKQEASMNKKLCKAIVRNMILDSIDAADYYLSDSDYSDKEKKELWNQMIVEKNRVVRLLGYTDLD